MLSAERQMSDISSRGLNMQSRLDFITIDDTAADFAQTIITVS